MGGVSIAIPYRIAELNPACVALNKTSISVTGIQEVISSGNGSSKANSYDFRIPGLSLAFPIPGSATVDARYTQVIDADFDLCRQDTIGEEPYLHELSRDGSVGNISIGLSKKFRPVTIGIRGGLNFGSFLDEQRLDFESGDYKDSYDKLTKEFFGLNYEIGLLYRLAGFSVGGFYRTSSELGNGLRLPQSYGVGISYSHGRAIFGADYITSMWHQSDNDYEDSYMAGIGCEYSVGSSKLRGGYRYSSSYYNQIREHTITAGFGFPFKEQNGGLELALEAGIRGYSGGEALRERLVRFGCTFWGLEKWKRRTTYP